MADLLVSRGDHPDVLHRGDPAALRGGGGGGVVAHGEDTLPTHVVIWVTASIPWVDIIVLS